MILAPKLKLQNPQDAQNILTFPFQYSGNQVYANRLVIKNNSTNAVVYDTKTTSYQLYATLPANTLQNGNSYAIQLSVFDVNDAESPLSQPILFQALSTPVVSFTNLTANQIIRNSTYTFTFSYVQAQNELLNEYQIILYDTNENQLLTTGILNNTTDLSGTLYGFSDNTQYYARITGNTVNGLNIDTGYVPFSVEYVSPESYDKLILENIPNDGTIKISSNVTLIDGRCNYDSPKYIDNTKIDLTVNKKEQYNGEKILFENSIDMQDDIAINELKVVGKTNETGNGTKSSSNIYTLQGSKNISIIDKSNQTTIYTLPYALFDDDVYNFTENSITKSTEELIFNGVESWLYDDLSINTITGTNVNISDASNNGEFTDFKVYGKTTQITEQNQTNLFDATQIIYQSNGLDISDISSTGFTLSGQSSGQSGELNCNINFPIQLTPNSTYHISYNSNAVDGIDESLVIRPTSDLYSWINSGDRNGSFSFKAPVDGNVTLCFQSSENADPVTVWPFQLSFENITLIVETGSTGYTAPIIGVNSVSITNDSNQVQTINLPKTAYSLQDGTVDIYNISTGSFVKNIESTTLNGQESWNYEGIYGINYCCFSFFLDSIAPCSVRESNLISDKFISSTDISNNECISQLYNYVWISILKSRLSDVSSSSAILNSFKTWLTSNNVALIYKTYSPSTIKVPIPNITVYQNMTITSDNGGNIFTKYVNNSNILYTKIQNTITDFITCSHFNILDYNNWGNQVEGISNDGSYIYLKILKSSLSSPKLSSLKTFFTLNNVKVLYKLKEPKKYWNIFNIMNYQNSKTISVDIGDIYLSYSAIYYASNNTITFSNDFSFSGDFTKEIKVENLLPYTTCYYASNGNDSIIIKYMLGKFSVNGAQQCYFLLVAKDNLATYRIITQPIDILSNTQQVGILVQRKSNLYDMSVTLL